MEYIYVIYKTTNTVNGKFYIGVHRTLNLNDGYMGCGHFKGRKIRENLDTPFYRALKKYGDSAFVTKILYSFNEESIAYSKEKELIDIKDPLCYNSKPGGIGGFHPDTNKGRIFTEEERLKMSKSAKERSMRLLLQTNILREFNKNRKGKKLSEIYGEEKAKEVLLKKSLSAIGKKHSNEAKHKMSLNRKGKDCGKCTGRKNVYNSLSNKVIRLIPSDLEKQIMEGSIINQFKRVSKFHNVNYIKIK
jgi:group I intron endonuclease